LGSLVLASTSEATAFGSLPAGAHAELGLAVPAIEAALRDFISYEKINYLMLMMVDPHVHFHVLPRYSGMREWQGLSFADAGWPGPPDLRSATALDGGQQSRLRDEIAARIEQSLMR
jgi:diadenosine tetraphosphate (Ap4A) HIT family hydrolase